MEVNNQISSSPNFFTGVIHFFITFLTSMLTATFLIAACLFLYWLIRKILFLSSISNHLAKNNKVFLLVKVPENSEQKESSMDEFLRSIHRILPDGAWFSLEMVSNNQFLSFYIIVASTYKNVLESQLYAQYPELEIEEVNDYLPDLSTPGQNIAFTEIGFKKSSVNPINTYPNMESDLLKNLSALLSKTQGREELIFQLILKKTSSKLGSRGLGALLFQLFGKKAVEDKGTPAQIKFSQDLYIGKVRILSISPTKEGAKGNLDAVVNIFKITKSPSNQLTKTKSHFFSTPISVFKARIFENGDLWNSSEVATIFHFPYKGSTVSNVVKTSSKRAPAPDILPYQGLVDPRTVSFFGETNFRNENKIFGIKRIDRRRHLYVVGKTGSGKSKLIELLLISDIWNGQGCCLLDPHGDLAEELLKFVPKERIKDVVYIDPADKQFPIGFNPLEPVDDFETRQHLATFFIAIFRKLFASNWNPRMEHLIRFITLALLETPDSNVLGIPRILSDTKFRQRVIMQIKDPVVKAFWTNEFSVSTDQYSREAIVPILNKVGQFISNPIVRNMIGQRKNMLDFSKFMNDGKIVIINISKGKLGDDNAALLGSMFITKIQQAALSRARVPEDERRDFYFYVDEFQNFATDAFSSILSEARKYHLDLTIAHQYIAQLPEEVKATAFGNIGSLIVFPIGGDDAEYLVKEFSPTFTADDMINLNLREMYVKMSVDGKLTPPFSARTINVPKPVYDYSEEILSHSRLTYGKSRVSVENEITRWTESAEGVNDTGSGDDFPEPII